MRRPTTSGRVSRCLVNPLTGCPFLKVFILHSKQAHALRIKLLVAQESLLYLTMTSVLLNTCPVGTFQWRIDKADCKTCLSVWSLPGRRKTALHPGPFLDTRPRAQSRKMATAFCAPAMLGSSSGQLLRWLSIRNCQRNMEVVVLWGALCHLSHSCIWSFLSFVKLSASRKRIPSKRKTLYRVAEWTFPSLALTFGNLYFVGDQTLHTPGKCLTTELQCPPIFTI